MKQTVYLKKSNKPGKKYMVLVGNKTIHFGQAGASDYTKHKDSDRKMRYTKRHTKENWNKAGIKTAGFWSRWLLWNKPSISASKSDISKKFGITFSSRWPKKASSRASPKSPRRAIKKSR